MTRTCSLLLAVVVAIYAVTAATTAETPVDDCPWTTLAPYENPVQLFGRWAVEQLHSSLDFDMVESARMQAVGDCASGTNRNYELVLYAFDPSKVDPGKYKAVVNLNAGVGQTLTYFHTL